jgi:hypothetical protein
MCKSRGSDRTGSYRLAILFSAFSPFPFSVTAYRLPAFRSYAASLLLAALDASSPPFGIARSIGAVAFGFEVCGSHSARSDTRACSILVDDRAMLDRRMIRRR